MLTLAFFWYVSWWISICFLAMHSRNLTVADLLLCIMLAPVQAIIFTLAAAYGLCGGFKYVVWRSKP